MALLSLRFRFFFESLLDFIPSLMISVDDGHRIGLDALDVRIFPSFLLPRSAGTILAW